VTRPEAPVGLAPDEYRELSRLTWSLGDYPSVAELLEEGARELVAQLDLGPGLRHLDVATGSGNVAVLAACAGAVVTGLDLTSEFFPEARRRAAEAGVTIELVEGDAEALPFPDETFDRVTSTYGVQFAPRHRLAAGEMARVCRPGGTIGLCNWTPEGWTGRFQEILSSYFPPPPPYASPPMLWGEEDYVRALFGTDFDVTAERRRLTYRFGSPEEMVSFFETRFGPFIIARRTISPRSRWRELRAEIVALTEESLVGEADEARVEPEYLLVLARKRGRP
jgi:SAM-dependent methyltransferase